MQVCDNPILARRAGGSLFGLVIPGDLVHACIMTEWDVANGCIYQALTSSRV